MIDSILKPFMPDTFVGVNWAAIPETYPITTAALLTWSVVGGLLMTYAVIAKCRNRRFMTVTSEWRALRIVLILGPGAWAMLVIAGTCVSLHALGSTICSAVSSRKMRA